MIRFVLARLLHYKSFYKFLALYVGVSLLLVFIASSVMMATDDQQLPLAQIFRMPGAWATVTAITRWTYYIFAFFTVQLVCAEQELRLVRAYVIAGHERVGPVLGWLLQSLLLTAVAVLVAIIAVLWRGQYGSASLSDAARPLVGFGLYGVVFLSISVLAALLMRRPVPTIALLCFWPLAIEPIVGLLLRRWNLDDWSAYFPFSTLSTLVAWPGSSPFVLAAPTTFAAAGYGLLALGASWLLLAKRDL